MEPGRWVLLVAVVAAVAIGVWRALSDGRFRGTHAVRGGSTGVSTGATGGGSTDGRSTGGGSTDGGSTDGGSVLAGTSYDGQRGERATLLQFSSAFCAPCRATRRMLADVAGMVPGVTHVEVDAEEHLDLVRAARRPAHADHAGPRPGRPRGHAGDGRAAGRARCSPRWRQRRLMSDDVDHRLASRVRRVVRRGARTPTVRCHVLDLADASAARWTTAACARRCVASPDASRLRASCSDCTQQISWRAPHAQPSPSTGEPCPPLATTRAAPCGRRASTRAVRARRRPHRRRAGRRPGPPDHRGACCSRSRLRCSRSGPPAACSTRRTPGSSAPSSAPGSARRTSSRTRRRRGSRRPSVSAFAARRRWSGFLAGATAARPGRHRVRAGRRPAQRRLRLLPGLRDLPAHQARRPPAPT